MRVGIFMHPIGSMRMGQEKYVFRVTTEMVKAAPEIDFVIYTKGTPAKEYIPVQYKNCTWRPLPVIPFWRELGIITSAHNEINVFFTERVPFISFSKVASVFFDSGYLQLQPTGVTQRIIHVIKKYLNIFGLWRSGVIVVPSLASADDVITMLGIAPSKIAVVYPGFDRICDSNTKTELLALKGRKFFSYVGPIKERKNVLGMVKAFKRFSEDVQYTHVLAIVGRTNSSAYSEQVHQYVEDNNLKDRVLFLGSVTEDELRYVYTETEAFLFPSTIEGFGLPILEAMSCGAIVVTSASGGTAEAAGTAGILVDTTNVDEFAQVLTNIASSTFDVALYKEKGIAHASSFSWERAGREWVAVLRKI